MKTEDVSFARFDGESAIQLILRFLLDGKIAVKVGMENRIYDGYVSNLNFAKGADHAFASVEIPKLGECGESVKVAIYLDGHIIILPDEAQGQ